MIKPRGVVLLAPRIRRSNGRLEDFNTHQVWNLISSTRNAQRSCCATHTPQNTNQISQNTPRDHPTKIAKYLFFGWSPARFGRELEFGETGLGINRAQRPLLIPAFAWQGPQGRRRSAKAFKN